MSSEISITKTNIIINKIKLSFEELEIVELLGSGANGYVIKVFDKKDDTIKALKIWAKIKDLDSRNKIEQGIKECEKLKLVDSTVPVPHIYTTGIKNGFFYSLMEYFDGITLKKWLTTKPPLYLRYEITILILKTFWFISIRDTKTIHGDLHLGNILVKIENNKIKNFLLIDFGTSIYSDSKNSFKRHWTVFENTLNKLLYPFSPKLFPKVACPPLNYNTSVRPIDYYLSATSSIPILINICKKDIFVTNYNYYFNNDIETISYLNKIKNNITDDDVSDLINWNNYEYNIDQYCDFLYTRFSNLDW